MSSRSTSATARSIKAFASDPRVTVIEGLNARDLSAADLGGKVPDFLVCDVSFISLTLALPPALVLASPGAKGVFLVKPQFEAGREAIGKGGILKDPAEGPRVAERLRAWLDAFPGWRALGICPSPVAGGDGNREFLLAGVKDRMSATFEIARLGAQGDGIAETETGPVFIPLRAARRDRHRRAREGPRRPRSPSCPRRRSASNRPAGISAPAAAARSSISRAGAYLDWKRQKVVQALQRGAYRRRGRPTSCRARRQTRRRVTFSARKTERGVVLGFNRAHSNEIVDIAECPISLPEIVASLDRLRVLAGMISATPQPFHMTVTATASGLDIAAEGAGKLGEGRRRAVSEFVVREGFARLSVDGEIIIEPKKPAMLFGDVAVPVPPGAFLQATAFAEQAMADLVASASLAREKGRRPLCRLRQLCAAAGEEVRGPCGGGRRRGACRARPRLPLGDRPEARDRRSAATSSAGR